MIARKKDKHKNMLQAINVSTLPKNLRVPNDTSHKIHTNGLTSQLFVKHYRRSWNHTFKKMPKASKDESSSVGAAKKKLLGKRDGVSKAKRAGLVFPVARVHRALKVGHFSPRGIQLKPVLKGQLVWGLV